jgi:hypothetical protein
MIIYQPMPNNEGTDPLKFRILLIHGLTEKHKSAVPCSAYGHPSTESPPKRLTEHHLLERIPATGKKAKPWRRCVVCSKHRKQKMKRNSLLVQ